MKTVLIVAALATCAMSTFAAEVAPSADGEFTSRTFTMPVSTAMAFPGKSQIDKTDVIVGRWGVDDELTEVVMQ